MSRKPSVAVSETLTSSAVRKPSAPGISFEPSGQACDDLLSQFVRSDFDSGNFVRNAVRKDTVSDDLAHLRQGIAVLESQLREQVVSHHGRLIEQVSHAKDLETMVTTVTAGVAKLQVSLGRVKSAIKDPYIQLQNKTLELDRLQFAGEMIRRIIRVRELSDKLRKIFAQVDGKDPRACIKDLTQAAGYVFEIQSCIARGDLSGIEEIEKQRGWLQDMDSKIQGKAYEVLRDAVLKRQQADIGSALQVFQQVEGLGGVVERLIADVLKLAAAATREALDTSTLPADDAEPAPKGRSAAATAAMQQQRGPSKAHAAAWKAALWARVEALPEALLARAWQVWTLRRVLVAKRDAVTQQTLLELVSPAYGGDAGDAKFFRSFWVRLFSAVGKALQAAADQNQFVRGMLTQDVARLRACFAELHEAWLRDAEPGAAGPARVVGDAERAAMLQALDPFQTQHVARVRSRLGDAVDAVLGKGGGAANPAEALALHKLVASSAHAARGDEALSLQLARTAQAALATLAQRARDGIARDADARAVGGHVTASHARNFALYNAALNVVSFDAQLGEGDAAREALAEAVEGVGRVVGETLEPLFEGLDAAVAAALVSMHEGPLDAAPPAAGPDEGADDAEDCSLYLRRAAAVVEGYLAKLAPRLQPSPHLAKRQGALAERLLGLFVRHAVLLARLEERDKMRLVKDMTKLEEVAGRLAPLKDLGGGGAYAALRALRPLLFLDDAPLATLPQRLADAAAAGRLRREDVLHALLQRAAPHLSPPFLCADPPSPARAQVLEAYSKAIDAEGGGAAVKSVKAHLEQVLGQPGPASEGRDLLRAILALASAPAPAPA